MADKHANKNPKLGERHKKTQQKGDRELAEGAADPGHSEPDRLPGRGKPDREEGVGTVQNRKR